MSRLTFFRHPSASSFLDRARGFLVAAEAENILLFGIAEDLGRRELSAAATRSPTAPNLFTVGADSAVVMATLQTPPRKLVVSRGPESAIEALVDGLTMERLSLPGVNGPVETARAFAEKWTTRSDQSMQPEMSLRVHELTRVIHPPEPPGAFRLAAIQDIPLLAEWADAFVAETGVDDTRSGQALVEDRVASGHLYVWDHNGPVSMAGWSGGTPSGVRVNSVYTPRELRGRGYASVCVASLSQLLLGRGYSFCALFTDLANPISNRLYQRIGYEPVSDFIEYRFCRGNPN